MLLNSAIIVIALVSLIVLLLIIGAPVKSIRFFGQSVIKLSIGTLFLFFFNVFGGSIGLHIPINLFTILISSVLGLFGVSSLAAMHIFLL